MRDDPNDAIVLLRTLADEFDEEAFDPDSPTARASLERILAAPPLTATRGRRRVPRRLALAAVPVAVAAIALAVVLSLSGSRAQIAQAAVLTRAAAALAQPNTILYVQEHNYGTSRLCVLGGAPSSIVPASLCVGNASGAGTNPISADPAQDTLNYSAQAWFAPDHSQVHTIYSNGNETASNADTQVYEAYDAPDNTLTTLTDAAAASPAPAPPDTVAAVSPLFFAVPADLADPAYYQDLYQLAQADSQHTSGSITLGSQFLGPTTINGESVYELQFTMQWAPPANPPAGDMCGSTVCAPPQSEVLLYLDSHTFMPVRSVVMTVNTNNQAGIPPGTSVADVVDFTVQALPDTTANEGLLQMSAHPGATQINETEAQYMTNAQAQAQSAIKAKIAPNLARTRRRNHNRR
jgi:hypothetical protein